MNVGQTVGLGSVMQTLGLGKTPMAVAALLALCGAQARAQDAQVFQLGEVEVVSTRAGADQTPRNTVTATEIRAQDRDTTGAALNMLPGVTLNKVGARNEQMVYVRGFDLRQVPVFIDGVPVYVPYDGYVDLGRFTTFDVSRIEVAKGFSSMVYGANTLGGAINIVSRKPQKAFEGEVGTGLNVTDHGEIAAKRAYANLGTNQGLWYLQAGASYLEQPYYRLPAEFAKTPAEDGGRRNNSDSRDSKVNVKVALTPGAGDEYALSVIRQRGQKGTPPYAGWLSTPRYWRWPYWDKDSVYLITDTAFGPHQLKTRVYHDEFRNSLYAYDDASYSTMKKKSSFKSDYNDFTNGASIEGDLQLAAANTLKAAAHWKEDVHREHNAGEPYRRFKDRTTSVGVEDAQQWNEQLSFVAGIGYDTRSTLEAQDYNSATKVVSDFVRDDGNALNGQVGAFYGQPSTGRAFFTIADKSRFPTIKDRYSYRMGTAIPNAALKDEQALHYEFGYARDVSPALRYDARIFYSDISNLIQSVTISPTLCTSAPCSQMQNIGKASSAGIELDVHGDLGAWRYAANYAYLDRRNHTGNGQMLTDTPRHKLFATLDWRLADAWSVGGSVDGMTRRYSSSDGKQVAPAFAIASLKGSWRATGALTVDVGVRNVFDRLYYLAEGFPEEGRTWIANANYRF